MLHVSYVVESTMCPVNASFSPRCNELINEPKRDYTNNRKGPLKIEDPKRRRSRTTARFYASIARS
jgi:hypothetical protein